MDIDAAVGKKSGVVVVNTLSEGEEMVKDSRQGIGKTLMHKFSYFIYKNVTKFKILCFR